MAETREEWGGYWFRRPPSGSVSIRGHPRRVWTDDGTWAIIRKKTEKCAKWKKLGRNGGDYCFRQFPRTSVEIRDAWGRKMKDAKLLGYSRKMP